MAAFRFFEERVRGGNLPLLALGLVLVFATFAVAPATGANPSSGTVSDASRTVTWQGKAYVLAAVPSPDECPPSIDPLNALCDHFFLTIDIAANFWDLNTGGVIIRITWPSSGDDFDLFVYTSPAGELVGFSAEGSTTFEEVLLFEPAPGQYEVRVVPFLVTNSATAGRAELSTAGFAPNPVHPTGGIAFAPAAVVDAQRTEGEPLDHIDQFGNIWESGPWGISTAQSFIHKSTDNGDSYHIVSLTRLRPDPPPGGGDTDIVTDDQGFAYFVDLEALAELGVAVSNDGGGTWRKNALGVPGTLLDRQWFALDDGDSPGAADNTVFLTAREIVEVGAIGGSQIFSTPGSTGPLDAIGGLVYENAATTLFVSQGSPCGQLKFDPVHRFLYLSCIAESEDRVEITRGHVDVGQRTGIAFETVFAPPTPGGVPGDIFPALAIDRAGNLFAVWVDETDHNVYVSASQDQGTTWTAPIQINGDPANVNVFAWAVAGGAGKLGVVFYGTAARGDPDSFPSWFENRQAATNVEWFPFYAQVHFDPANLAAAPAIFQVPVTTHPTHFGQVCNLGLFCTVINGDRTMADFFAVAIDREGAARVVYDDTTNQHHGAAVFEARQIAGPTLVGTTLAGVPPTNPISDPVDDAEFPHYAPTGEGPNQDHMDFVGLDLSQPKPDELRVRMVVRDASSLLPPLGAQSTIWLTRFQVKAFGDGGEESFRIFYVGAKSVGGVPPTFFSGTGTSASNEGIMGNGCITTTPRNCKIILYPAEKAQSGSLDPETGEIVIDVALADIGNPQVGDTLFSVTALSLGEIAADPLMLMQDIDATRAFDFVITKGPGVMLRRVTGGGHIDTDAQGSNGNFGLVGHTDNRGKVSFIDHATGMAFKSAFIESVTIDGNTATIKGTGFVDGVFTTFVVTVQDVAEPGTGADTFSINLGTGYARSGILQGGNVRIR